MLSYHSEELHTDLPLHIRFLDARRHDSVSLLVTLREFRTLNPDISIKNLCLDSAHDNYPTYNLCKAWDIRPFIDLNSNGGRPPTIPGHIRIDSDGTPICQAGFRMVYWGFCSERSRCKWRCPVARGTEEYKKIYNNRTASERVNNRILNDYHLHDMRIHTRKRYSFFAMIAGINIHLDARLKMNRLTVAA